MMEFKTETTQMLKLEIQMILMLEIVIEIQKMLEDVLIDKIKEIIILED